MREEHLRTEQWIAVTGNVVWTCCLPKIDLVEAPFYSFVVETAFLVGATLDHLEVLIDVSTTIMSASPPIPLLCLMLRSV
jgi:hypothetical protein